MFRQPKTCCHDLTICEEEEEEEELHDDKTTKKTSQNAHSETAEDLTPPHIAFVESLLELQSLEHKRYGFDATGSCELNEWADFHWWFDPWAATQLQQYVRREKEMAYERLNDPSLGHDIDEEIRKLCPEYTKNPAIDKQIVALCQSIEDRFGTTIHFKSVYLSARAASYYNERVGRPDVPRDPLEAYWNKEKFRKDIRFMLVRKFRCTKV